MAVVGAGADEAVGDEPEPAQGRLGDHAGAGVVPVDSSVRCEHVAGGRGEEAGCADAGVGAVCGLLGVWDGVGCRKVLGCCECGNGDGGGNWVKLEVGVREIGGLYIFLGAVGMDCRLKCLDWVIGTCKRYIKGIFGTKYSLYKYDRHFSASVLSLEIWPISITNFPRRIARLIRNKCPTEEK